MTKVLFLDFDGVLNSRLFFQTRKLEDAWSEVEDIDRSAVERLNAIIAATGAYVVVSSSWRHGRTTEQLAGLLQARGFRGVVIDKIRDWHTPHSRRLRLVPMERPEQRGDQIKDWLDEHPHVERYAILDDDTDMDAVREHHIKTDFHTGLQLEHVERAIEMLR